MKSRTSVSSTLEVINITYLYPNEVFHIEMRTQNFSLKINHHLDYWVQTFSRLFNGYVVYSVISLLVNDTDCRLYLCILLRVLRYMDNLVLLFLKQTIIILVSYLLCRIKKETLLSVVFLIIFVQSSYNTFKKIN